MDDTLRLFERVRRLGGEHSENDEAPLHTFEREGLSPQRFELMQIQGEIGGQSVPFFVATASACDYMSSSMVRHLGLTPVKLEKVVKVRFPGGAVGEVGFHVHTEITFPGHPYALVQRRTFLVMPNNDDSFRVAVLGHPWVKDNNTPAGITFGGGTALVATQLPLTFYKPEDTGTALLLSTEII